VRHKEKLMQNVPRTVTPSPRAIYFPVDRVPLPVNRLPETKTHEAVRARLGGRVEACRDYTSTSVASHSHPLVDACLRAWLDHRPLALTPDDIWLAIAQTFAQHVHENAAHLRAQLVSHDGREPLVVDGSRWGFVPRSPENPWPLVFAEFANEIRAKSPVGFDLVVTEFTTTGPAELAAQQVALMDALQSYFDYVFLPACGLPGVTLYGDVSDGERLRAKAAVLGRCGLERWVRKLDPILGRLEATARGSPDLGFWRDLVRFREEGRGCGKRRTVNGWLTTLLPFGRRTGTGLQLDGERSVTDFPSGLSAVPVREINGREVRALEFVAGFVGIAQRGLELRPRIGWAVCEPGAK
jgi:hypothetical protein